MLKSKKFLVTMGIAVVLWLGSIFLLYNSYSKSSVIQFQIRDGAIVTDANGDAVRMTLWQEKGILILLSTVVFVGGGFLIGAKAAKSQ